MNGLNLEKIRNGLEKNLRGANLQDAKLQDAKLQDADLRGAKLQDAKLQDADLRGADLRGADLRGAYLRGADLRGAYLRGADLPSPTMVLLARWGKLSSVLTTVLMRLDCYHGPGQKAFDDWANNKGPCPYRGFRFQRVANFRENRELWSPGDPPSFHECAMLVLKECTKIGEEK